MMNNKIRLVIRTANDEVMVFDSSGEQVTEYQGAYREVKDRILADAPLEAVFYYWYRHASRPVMVSRETW